MISIWRFLQQIRSDFEFTLKYIIPIHIQNANLQLCVLILNFVPNLSI